MPFAAFVPVIACALVAVERVGTIAPTGRYPLPAETTAVSGGVLRFEEDALVLSVLWDAGDGYIGTAIGPESDLPLVTLAPASADTFVGWVDGTSVETSELRFVTTGGRTCFDADGLEACRTSPTRER